MKPITFFPIKFDIAENLLKYTYRNFLSIRKSAIQLSNENLNESCNLLQFKIPKYIKETKYKLKIIDIGRLNEIMFDSLSVNSEGFFIFDNQTIFNPIKRLPWINTANEVLGDTFNFEIIDDKNSISLKKFVCMNYFSYENYILTLLQITNMISKTDKEKLQKYNKLNEIGRAHV